MASTMGVHAAIRVMAENINRDANAGVDKLASNWMKRFADIDDTALLAAAKRWNKPRWPLIPEIDELLGPARKSSWPDGCDGCKGSGMRVVMRHTSRPGRPFMAEEFTAACVCALGKEFTTKRGQVPYPLLEDRWRGDEGTLDQVVVIDPEPLHRHPKHEWAAREARAEANTDAVLAYLAPEDAA